MRISERGDGKIGVIIMILILAAVVFVLVKMVPPRINAYQFNDFMDVYARQDCWTRTPKQMKKDLVAKAQELKLPVTEKDIKIRKKGAYVEMEATFDLPIDLKVHTWVLHYEFKTSAEHY